jgi:hypothetical protein
VGLEREWVGLGVGQWLCPNLPCVEEMVDGEQMSFRWVTLRKEKNKFRIKESCNYLK